MASRALDEAAEWLRKSFRAEAAAHQRGTIALDLTGPGGGSLALAIGDEQLSIERVAPASAQARLCLSLEDFLGILEGRENPDLLYLAGRLEIEGDLSLAMKMRTLFRPRA